MSPTRTLLLVCSVALVGAVSSPSDADARRGARGGHHHVTVHRNVNRGRHVNRSRNINRSANVNRHRNTNKKVNSTRNRNINKNVNVNRSRDVSRTVNRNVNVGVVRGWSARPYFGTVVGGVVLGSIITAAAVGAVPASPDPNVCWFWTDDTRTQGYWTYCNEPNQ